MQKCIWNIELLGMFQHFLSKGWFSMSKVERRVSNTNDNRKHIDPALMDPNSCHIDLPVS
jgi:hypothetical protein